MAILLAEKMCSDKNSSFWKQHTVNQPFFFDICVGKYSFVNRSITDWNQLPEGAIGTSQGKTHIFKTRVGKLQNSGGSEDDKK